MHFVKILIANVFTLVAILCHPDNALGVDCSTNKIYCAIMKINPEARDAMELSNYLYKYSKEYSTDPLVSVAIIAQESMFRNVVAGDDYGLFQFNKYTIEIYNLNKLKILEDLEYATRSHVWLLKKKINYCKDLYEKPWVCYHSATPEHAANYRAKVSRYLKTIRGTK